EQLASLTATAHYLDELLNFTPNPDQPYVGRNAFAHKGGMHVAGVNADPATFEHIEPDVVGNRRELIVSELSGKGTVHTRAQAAGKAYVRAAEGSATVNALDRAVRDASGEIYPHLADIEVENFKVRLIDEHAGTASVTRVLIDASDGDHVWGSIGVSENIIEAS